MFRNLLVFSHDKTRISSRLFCMDCPGKMLEFCNSDESIPGTGRCNSYRMFQIKNQLAKYLNILFSQSLEKINIFQYILSVHGYPDYRN